jgi:hypothetical protein
MHEVFASGQLTNHFVVFSKGTVMGLFLVKLKSSLRKLYVATMTWWTVIEYTDKFHLL